jgi:protein-disulfide isomerase
VSATRPEAQLTVPVSADRDHIQGPDGAPVTLVEHGDYECPYCGAAYPVLKEIQAQMGERLRFVFRNFPITNSHPHAQEAAEAAEAAAAQGHFWEMHDQLYEHQDHLRLDHLRAYARAMVLDLKRFDHALAYRPRMSSVLTDAEPISTADSEVNARAQLPIGPKRVN